MTDRPPDVVLVLRPLPDPLAGPGVPPRDPDYRLRLVLKRLLRDFGFKAVAVRDAPPEENATCENRPTPS